MDIRTSYLCLPCAYTDASLGKLRSSACQRVCVRLIVVDAAFAGKIVRSVDDRSVKFPAANPKHS